MDNRKFSYFEDDQLKNLNESINYVKNKTGKILDDKANGEVFNDALNNRIANSVDNNMTAQVPQNGVNSNAKVLVREKRNIPNMMNNSSNPVETKKDNSIYENYRNVESSDSPQDSDPFGQLRDGGNITVNTILIVIASLVIISMIVIICLTVLGDIGVLPLK